MEDLWIRLSSGQQVIAGRAVVRALEVLAGVVGEEAAPQMLADRLRDRMAEAGGGVLVREPMAWLLGRGLVQRQACADLRYDDGIRLDTRSDCPACAAVTADRRAMRKRVRAELETCPELGTSQAFYEQRLREHTLREADRARARNCRAAAEVEQRRTAAAMRRQREEAAERARRSAPCTDCGLPEAAGLCPLCSYARHTDLLVKEAVDLAVAVRADLEDTATVAALTQQCETDTRALLASACEQACRLCQVACVAGELRCA